jgi:ribonuclease E
MVLESNRDLVLRRLTEALARDRTRHQVSEVTSLGLVQLTRKRLGTGLIEAFSTSCPHCGGRGILLHTDPVDSSQASRKSESGGRRGRRSRKSRDEELAVARVPAHAPGEHPMFKAMAAANGRHDSGEATDGEPSDEDKNGEDEGAEVDSDTIREAVVDDADELLEDEDFDESDEDDEEEEDEIDVDLDEDEDDALDDLDIDDDEDDDDDDVEPIEEETSEPAAAESGRQRRRRSAARPAGPPIHED